MSSSTALALTKILQSIERRLPADPDDLAVLDMAAAGVEEFVASVAPGQVITAATVPSINSGSELEDAKNDARNFQKMASYLQRSVDSYADAPESTKVSIVELLSGEHGVAALRTLRNHLEALATARAVKDPTGAGIPSPSYDMIGSLKEIHAKLDTILERLL